REDKIVGRGGFMAAVPLHLGGDGFGLPRPHRHRKVAFPADLFEDDDPLLSPGVEADHLHLDLDHSLAPFSLIFYTISPSPSSLASSSASSSPTSSPFSSASG